MIELSNDEHSYITMEINPGWFWSIHFINELLDYVSCYF